METNRLTGFELFLENKKKQSGSEVGKVHGRQKDIIEHILVCQGFGESVRLVRISDSTY